MSEFTKLGGYLIQGQPEVVHDNTLSGNGTAQWVSLNLVYVCNNTATN